MARNMAAALASADVSAKATKEKRSGKAAWNDKLLDRPLQPSTDPQQMHSSRLRERRLLDLSVKPLTMGNMRSLFRLVDMDGSQEVSPSEIQRGLLLLGFSAALDPVALSRVLLDIDEDKTGTITEPEFLAFFRAGVSRKQLQESLASYVIGRTCMKATIIRKQDGLNHTETKYVSEKDLKGLFSKVQACDKSDCLKLWLDVVGFDDRTNSQLAQIIGVTAEELRDSMLFQEPQVSAIESTSGMRAKIICHTQSCSVDPLRCKRRGLIDILPWPLSACYHVITGVAPKDSDVELVPGSVIARNPPCISVEQATILVVDDATIITLRVPCFQPGEDGTRFRKVPETPEQDPLVHDGSLLESVYQDLRRQLTEESPIVDHLFSGSAKSLAVVLVDAILTHNNQLSDRMADWMEALTSSVQKGVCSKQTTHIASFLTLKDALCSNLQPLMKVLNPKEWNSTQTPGHPGVEGDIAKRSSKGIGVDNAATDDAQWWQQRPSSRNALDRYQWWEPNGKRQSQQAPAEQVIRADVGSKHVTRNVAQPQDLHHFFRMQTHEFSEMSQNISNIHKNMQRKREQVQELVKLIATKKQDMMNNTLYALTLITTLTIPMAFFTGLFGMNFEDMYELYPKGLNETLYPEDWLEPIIPVTGYKLFWILLCSVEGVIILIMLRLGLFDALM